MFRLVTIVMDSYMLVNVMVTLLSINSSGKYSLYILVGVKFFSCDFRAGWLDVKTEVEKLN